MIKTPQDTSLTLAEAAEFLRCSPNTLRSLARQGKVGFKVGKEYGFLVSQLVEYAKLCNCINDMASGKESIRPNSRPRSCATGNKSIEMDKSS